MKFILIFAQFFITLTLAQFIQRDPDLENKMANLTNMKNGDMTVEEFDERKFEIEAILLKQSNVFNNTFLQFMKKSKLEGESLNSNDFIKIN